MQIQTIEFGLSDTILIKKKYVVLILFSCIPSDVKIEFSKAGPLEPFLS